VLASVLSQPSVPIALTGAHKRDPGFSEKEMKVIEKRAAEDNLCALALRFSGDPMAPAERFATLKDRLGDNFEVIELDSSPGNSGGFGRMAHSVLTLEVRERAGQQCLATASRAEQEDVRLLDLDVGTLAAEREPLVVAVDGDGEHPLGVLLPDHVFVEMGHDLAGRGDRREELLARASAALLLVEDRLAELDAFAADVDVARALDERPHIPVTLAAKRAEGILLGRAPRAAAPEIVDVFP
jgi:hypothetical protein